MPERFHYDVFGLTIGSEIPLPELFPATSERIADVTVRRGSLGQTGSAAGLRVENDQSLLLTIPDVAQYRIRGGREIIVDPAAVGVPERNVRLYLLGSALGAVLHQRGLLPLHANAVEIDGKAVAFMGESGAGKSTLAAWFYDQGYRVLADDVCVVRFVDNGDPFVSPGLPRLRLWENALLASGRRPSDYARSYAGDEQYNKYDVPLARDASASAEVPLGLIYVLKTGETFSITCLAGVAAADAVFANTYRGAYVGAVASAEAHWSNSLRLVRKTQIFKCERIWDSEMLEEQAKAILDHVSDAAKTYLASASVNAETRTP